MKRDEVEQHCLLGTSRRTGLLQSGMSLSECLFIIIQKHFG